MKLKRILSVLIVLTMVLGMVGVPVFASTKVAKVGDTEYAAIDEAISAWTNGTTLTLLSNVTVTPHENTANSYDIRLNDGIEWEDVESVEITFPATEGANDGDNAYVVHEHGDNKYYYVGKVANGTITITNNIGFSTFTVNAGGFSDALNNAQDGDTIILLEDVALDGTTNITKSVTIDGNGYKIKQSDTFVSNGANAVFDIMSGATATFNNVTFDGIKDVAVMRTVNADVVMNNCVVSNCTHTATQGLLRLACGNATITDSQFINNDCTMVITFGFDAANDTDVLTIDGCLFKENTCSGTAVVYFADGGAGTVTDTKFTDNEVSTNGNAATLYWGWGVDTEISGCTFEENVVTTSHASTKRFASAIFFDTGIVTNNIFKDNTAKRNDEEIKTTVAAAAYYGAADVSANYWNDGEEPVKGEDYTVEYNRNTVDNDSYYKTVNEDGSLGELVNMPVAKVGETKYETLSEAISNADSEPVELLKDIEESITAIENVEFFTNVAGGVTVTSTYTDDWIDFNNVTVNSGITLTLPNVFCKTGENTIYGTLNAGTETSTTTLYHGYDAKTVVKNGGRIIVSGDTVMRYNNNAGSGIYIYGDGNDETVEYSSGLYSGGYIGAYSGTFYAEDAVVKTGGLRLDYKKNSSEEPDSYAPVNAEFVNSIVNVLTELRLYKDANLTLTNSNVTAGKVQVRESATPTVNIDSESVLKADTVENLTGASINAKLGEDGVVTFVKFVAKIGDKEFTSLQDAIDTAVNGDTIIMIADTEEDATVGAEADITIDLAGFDIVGSLAGITNNGTLTINDSVGTGNVYTTDVSAQGRPAILNNGNITINGGWFGDSNNDMTDRNAINRGNAVKNYGTAVINGGYFTNVSNQYIDVNAYAYAINTLAGGTTTVNNATVYGDINGLIYSEGTTIVKDGSYTLGRPNEENNLWYLAYGNVEICGGTWTRAFKVPSWNTGDLTVCGDVKVSGGIYNVNIPETNLKDGCILTGENGKITADRYQVFNKFDMKMVGIYDFELTQYEGNDTYPVALFGALSSISYLKVGFVLEYELDGEIKEYRYETKDAYRSIIVGDAVKEKLGNAVTEDNKLLPSKVDENATHFYGGMVHFATKYADSPLRIRPFAQLLDGTYVYGEVRDNIKDITNKN